MKLSGGLEAARLERWHVEEIVNTRFSRIWFAYDEPKDFEPLVYASRLLKEAGLMNNHRAGCYVLCGWPRDTMAAAEERCWDAAGLGFFPQAMLYNRNPDREWRRFQNEWANKIIVGYKMKELKSLQPVDVGG